MKQQPRAVRPHAWLDRVVDALAVIAGALLCGLVVLICMDVAARTFRLFPMPWSLDVSEYALYGITFFGAPWVLREQGHIAIEMVVERLAPPARLVLRRITDAIGAVVCVVLVYYSVRALLRSYNAKNLVHETFVFPEWYLYVIAPPTFALLLLLFLRDLIWPAPDAPVDAASKGA